MIVKIHGRSFGVGLGHDTKSVLLMLHLLARGENLHECLLWRVATSRNPKKEAGDPAPRGQDTCVSITMLQSDDVLRLQSLRAFADFKFDSLALVQAAVAFRLNGGEMNKNVLARLPLNKTVAFTCVEPLHCSLFLHFQVPRSSLT